MENDSTDSDEEVEEVPKVKEEKKVVKKKAKRRRVLTINLTNCKYDSVCRVAKKFGLKPVGDDEDWTVFWTDTSVLLERVMDMKRYQKINHFPGMIEICRKDLLARNMNRMLKMFPKEYCIFPRSWCLPADFGDFQAYCRSKKNVTFISKPESGCQGKGIFVFKNPREIKAGEHCVVQQYISKPFIMDGFKFDLRIYVLVTSCDPIRIYVYKDGLGRFATVKYHEPSQGNVDEQCMHLTNYAINKTSKDFVRDDDSGSKRRITTVNQWFVDHDYNLYKIWDDIEDVIIKTVIAAHPILRHNYRSCFPNHTKGSACFEILGFDVLLDKKLKPWLIEVNHSPSFHTDAPLDKEVKEGLLQDTLDLIDLYSNDKRKCIEEDKRRVKERLLRQKSKEASQNYEEEMRAKYKIHLEKYEMAHSGGFRRIYPREGGEEAYAKFFDQSTSLCAETAASRARTELSRMQREDIETKQKELEHFRKKLSGAKPSKSDEVRPESPSASEKKAKPKSLSLGRRVPVRIPLYTSKADSRQDSESTTPAEGSGTRSRQEQQQEMAETPIVPYGEGVSPQAIKDDEELERLAGMQLRDNLVRGLGVSNQLRASFRVGSGNAHVDRSTSYTDTSTHHPPQKPTTLFSSRYHPHHHQDTALGEGGYGSLSAKQQLTPGDHDQRTLRANRDTPSHSVTGTASSVKIDNECSSVHHLAKPQHWPNPKPCAYHRTHAPRHIHNSTTIISKPSLVSQNRYLQQSLMHHRPHPQHAQVHHPTSLAISSQLLGLSVISAPIRLAARGNPPHPAGDHWNYKDSLMPSDKPHKHSSSTTVLRTRHLGILETHSKS